MDGTAATTDYGWYEFLFNRANLDEVNFWTPFAIGRFAHPNLRQFRWSSSGALNMSRGNGTKASSEAVFEQLQPRQQPTQPRRGGLIQQRHVA